MAWKEMDNNTIGHLLIIERIDSMQQVVYFFFSLDYIHQIHQLLKLFFAYDSIRVFVYYFE